MQWPLRTGQSFRMGTCTHPAEDTEGGHPYQDGQPDHRGLTAHVSSGPCSVEDQLTYAEKPQGTWSHTQGTLGSLLLPGEDIVPGAEPEPGVELWEGGASPPREPDMHCSESPARGSATLFPAPTPPCRFPLCMKGSSSLANVN